MSIDIKQLMDFVIAPSLRRLDTVLTGCDSVTARQLLLATACHESHAGAYLRQVTPTGGYGAAMGIYQIEMKTSDWIWSWLNRQTHRPIQDVVVAELSRRSLYPYYDQLMTNLSYQTMMCRLRYWLAPASLDADADLEYLANYWGKYYQTDSQDRNKLDNKELAFIANTKRLAGEYFK